MSITFSNANHSRIKLKPHLTAYLLKIISEVTQLFYNNWKLIFKDQTSFKYPIDEKLEIKLFGFVFFKLWKLLRIKQLQNTWNVLFPVSQEIKWNCVWPPKCPYKEVGPPDYMRQNMQACLRTSIPHGNLFALHIVLLFTRFWGIYLNLMAHL